MRANLSLRKSEEEKKDRLDFPIEGQPSAAA